MSDAAKKLLAVTKESLELAIDKARAGNRLFDICGTVEQHVVGNGFSVVREMVGHGIGTKLHEEPQVPNYVDRRNENPRLKEGMVLAIEPMVNAGAADMRVLSDKWTAVTKDGSCSAHFEHCVAVTAERAVGFDAAVTAVDAVVVELLPSAVVKVKLENQEVVLAHPAGAAKTNFVRVRPGDRVAGGVIAARSGPRKNCSVVGEET